MKKILPLLLFFLSGCFHHTHKPSPFFPEPEERKNFVYEKKEVAPEKVLEKEEKKFRIYRLDFDFGRVEKVRVNYYFPVGGGDEKRALILILPILAGDDYFFSRYFAEGLVKDGFAVITFERKKGLLKAEEGLGNTTRLIKDMVDDIRRIIDWAEVSPEIESRRIGIMGISFGAIVAALTQGREARIKDGVFLLGGADLAGILKNSSEDTVINFREKVMQRKGFGLEGFFQEAKTETAGIEPLNFRPHLPPENILMLNGVFDTVIPNDNSEKLWEYLGRPEKFRYWSGHYSAVIYLPHARYKTIRHFRRVLRGGE